MDSPVEGPQNTNTAAAEEFTLSRRPTLEAQPNDGRYNIPTLQKFTHPRGHIRSRVMDAFQTDLRSLGNDLEIGKPKK